MGMMAELLRTLRVSASSPDGQIKGVMSGQSDIEITFERESFENYDAATIEQQLNALCGELFTAYQCGYFRVLSEVSGRTVTVEAPPRDRQSKEFRMERDAIVCDGVSQDGFVGVERTGKNFVRFNVSDDTFDHLSESEFSAEVSTSILELNRNLNARIALLKFKYYGSERAKRAAKNQYMRRFSILFTAMARFYRSMKGKSHSRSNRGRPRSRAI